MIKAILFVGAGGFVGSVFRYLIQLFISKHFVSSFPWPTFMVNILGCLLIGMLYALANREQWMTPELRLLLMTGFCGGFTTFSTFSFDSVKLLQQGYVSHSLLYILASVVLGILFAYLGVRLIRIF